MTSSRAPAPNLDRVAYELAVALPALHRALERRLAGDFPHPKLPDGQLALLRLVREHAGITVRQAAARLSMKPNNVSALVSQSVAEGRLERRRDQVDGRVAHLYVTDEARRRIDEVDALLSGYLADALRHLSDGELDAIGSVLSSLQDLSGRIRPASE